MKAIAELLNNFSDKLSENGINTEKLRKEYPASSWIKLISLKNYREQNNPEFETLRSDSGIYFNNPVWYSYVLSEIEKTALKHHVQEKPESVEEESHPKGILNEEKLPDITENPAGIIAIDETEVPEVRTEENEDLSADEPTPPMPVNKGTTIKEPLNEASGPIIPIEPLHTVDYFAWQGIRLTTRDLKDDNLSQQVRSFTGWLKQMKKTHPTRLLNNPDINEQIVRQEAEKSNINLEVYTEAMAEVLIKQNKFDKAIEMYQKLSLMNPAKSAYFAARIENLKTT